MTSPRRVWDRAPAWARTSRAWLVGVLASTTLACSKPEEPATPPVPAAPMPSVPVAPPPPPHPTTEDGVLQAFTQALERQDLAALTQVVAPELGAELKRLHQTNPAEFWSRGGLWVDNAKTGLSIATHADDAFKVPRWRALVRFGNGVEETVEFTQIDGKLLLAEP